MFKRKCKVSNFFFGMQLGVLVLRHTDKSSSTLRYTHMYMSYYKAQVIGKICFSSLQGMREEASFRRFFEKVRVLKQKLEIDDPKPP